MRVLFVDDEPDLLQQYTLLLEKKNEDLEIDTTTSAEEGLELLNNGDYDAIISDYKMPGMDGLDFLMALRDGEREIPFIILTGQGREDVAMEALNLGANRYVRKSISPDSLANVLARTVVHEVEKRRRDKELVRSEKKYRNIFQKMGVPAVLIDKNSEIDVVNEQFEGLSGYSREEIEGRKSLKDFVRGEGSGSEGYVGTVVENCFAESDTQRFRFINKEDEEHDVLINLTEIPGIQRILAWILEIPKHGD